MASNAMRNTGKSAHATRSPARTTSKPRIAARSPPNAGMHNQPRTPASASRFIAACPCAGLTLGMQMMPFSLRSKRDTDFNARSGQPCGNPTSSRAHRQVFAVLTKYARSAPIHSANCRSALSTWPAMSSGRELMKRAEILAVTCSKAARRRKAMAPALSRTPRYTSPASSSNDVAYDKRRFLRAKARASI